MDSEYKEGREYVLKEFVKEGSYGEVHIAQDVNTGFRFAVKKVRQSILLSVFFHCRVSKCALIAHCFFSILTDRPEEVQQ